MKTTYYPKNNTCTKLCEKIFNFLPSSPLPIINNIKMLDNITLNKECGKQIYKIEPSSMFVSFNEGLIKRECIILVFCEQM